jgi:hypothetical protein
MLENRKMKTKHHIENETVDPTAGWCGCFLKDGRKPALSSIVLSVAIVCCTGCSSTGGFKARLVAPDVRGGQGVNFADDGWYHPPESPGRGQG